MFSVCLLFVSLLLVCVWFVSELIVACPLFVVVWLFVACCLMFAI